MLLTLIFFFHVEGLTDIDSHTEGLRPSEMITGFLDLYCVQYMVIQYFPQGSPKCKPKLMVGHVGREKAARCFLQMLMVYLKTIGKKRHYKYINRQIWWAIDTKMAGGSTQSYIQENYKTYP